MRLLIDGYNLLFQSGLLPRRRGPDGLERARRALLRTLAGLLRPEEVGQTVIVFDARQRPAQASPNEFLDGITVRYAVDYPEADELLEELIRRESTPKRLTVVSSDHRVLQAARRRRAIGVAAEAWWDERLQQRGRSPDPRDDEDESHVEKPDVGNPFPQGYGDDLQL